METAATGAPAASARLHRQAALAAAVQVLQSIVRRPHQGAAAAGANDAFRLASGADLAPLLILLGSLVVGSTGDDVGRVLRACRAITAVQEDEAALREIDWHTVQFSGAEFELALQRCELGRGTYGVVHQVRHRRLKLPFAVKSIDKKFVCNGGLRKQVLSEARVQMRLRHVNVLRCVACLENSRSIYLITECCARGDLYAAMRRQPTRRLHESEVFFYFVQLVNGLRYIHSQGYSHRDLKLENLLLTEDYILKIADFGWVAHILGRRGNYNFCGTLDYLAPEMVRGSGHDWRADAWSVGVLLFEIAAGKPPFQSTRHFDLTGRILGCDIDASAARTIAPDLLALIESFLQVEPDDRLRLEESLGSAWARRMWARFHSKLLGAVGATLAAAEQAPAETAAPGTADATAGAVAAGAGGVKKSIAGERAVGKDAPENTAAGRGAAESPLKQHLRTSTGK